MRTTVAAAVVALFGGASFAGEAPPQPDGYRMEAYRAPTPTSLDGGRTIGTEEARALWEAGDAAFVDVLPRPPRPEGLPDEVYWRPPERRDIPGSVWLANTGFGALSPDVRAYLEVGLEEVTGGDRTHATVFYCQRDCWMSWNAAKRALALGYEAVIWYPEGTDGWGEAGLPLETREPRPMETGDSR